MLKKFFAKFTSEQKLKYSIIYGWFVLIFFVVIDPLWTWAIKGSNPVEKMMIGLFAAGVFLSIRYSMMQPMLRTASEGAKVVGFAYVLGLLFNRRNSGPIGFGALLGVLFYLVVILAKNTIKSIFYLIKETLAYVEIRNERHQLNDGEFVAAGTEPQSIEKPHHPPLIQQSIIDSDAPNVSSSEYMQKHSDHITHAIIADYYYNPSMIFGWKWFGKSEIDPYYSNNKTIMVGGKDKGRDRFVQNFSETKFSYDELSVYRVTFDSKPLEGKEMCLGGMLPGTEIIPGNQLILDEEIKVDPEFSDFKEVTLEARAFFADTYFAMLANLKNVRFEELFPDGGQFDQENGSPLSAYEVMIEKSPYQGYLSQQLTDFGMKSWVKTESGYIRAVQDELTSEEKALILFETLWEMFTLPGYFSQLRHHNHLVFHIDIPNEVMQTEFYRSAFNTALQYLIYRSEWKNYNISLLVTIDEPNELLRLPFNYHVLFEKEHVSSYKKMTNQSITPQQTQVLQNIDPGTCCWLDFSQELALGLRLYTEKKIVFRKEKQQPVGV